MTPPVRRLPDVRYGEVLGYRPLELDLYVPAAERPLPVIVHVHGGGWRRGSRREPLPALGTNFYDGLAAQGFNEQVLPGAKHLDLHDATVVFPLLRWFGALGGGSGPARILPATSRWIRTMSP